MGRVAIVRHGQTELNKGAAGESAERVRGWREIELDDEGRREAVRLAHEFKDYDVAEVYSSPLNRAKETASGIAAEHHLQVHVMPSLLPWNLGDWQGQKVVDVKEAMAKYTVQETKCVPGGEPFAAYRERFLSFLADKLRAAQSLPPDKFLVLVTHSRGLQTTKSWAAAGFPEDLSIDTDVMNDYSNEVSTGGVVELAWPEGDGEEDAA